MNGKSLRVLASIGLAVGAAVLIIGALIFAPRTTRPTPEISIGELPDRIGPPQCDREQRVETPDQLEQVLRSDFVGCVIVAKDKFLNMAGRTGIPIRGGVTLMGERGFLGSRPLLYTTQKIPKRTVFEVQGNDVQVVGLHFRGPSPAEIHKEHISDSNPYVHAIRVKEDAEQGLSGRRVVIADNEFDEWSGAGVVVTGSHNTYLNEWEQHGPDSSEPWKHLDSGDAGLVRVERNYMHHNVMDGGGYGVTVDGGAYVTIDGNVFDFNRHAVAADGDAHEGYVARFNYVLQGGYKQESSYAPDYYNQHFDVHGDDDGGGDGYGGWAGTFFMIANNTIRGEQNYGIWPFRKTRPALLLRGRAAQVAFFNDNILAHDDLDAAVSLKKDKSDSGIGESHTDFNFRASGNLFNTDYSAEIAGGDFDGDGRTDVFVATGTAWFFSRAGIRPWEYLTGSGRRTQELGFGDIDNDGVTDVLWRDSSGNVFYSRSGRVGFAALTSSPVPMSELRFGDFDGDGLTDIFYTQGGQWQVWYGRTRSWTPTQTSSKPISELLFGEFDEIRGTDVVGINNDGWAYSSGSTKRWEWLNGKLVNSFAKAVAADFDGNGKSDIAVDEGSKWRYSRDGRSPLEALMPNRGGPGPPGSLKKMIIGLFHFPAPLAEVVTFGPTKRRGEVPQHHDRLVYFDAQRCCFSPLSSQNMR